MPNFSENEETPQSQAHNASGRQLAIALNAHPTCRDFADFDAQFATNGRIDSRQQCVFVDRVSCSVSAFLNKGLDGIRVFINHLSMQLIIGRGRIFEIATLTCLTIAARSWTYSFDRPF